MIRITVSGRRRMRIVKSAWD